MKLFLVLAFTGLGALTCALAWHYGSIPLAGVGGATVLVSRSLENPGVVVFLVLACCLALAVTLP